MRSFEANIALAVGNRRGLFDASNGVIPPGPVAARDYWIISFSGLIGDVYYRSGSIMMANKDAASTPDDFFMVYSQEDIVFALYELVGSIPKIGWCLTRCNPAYNGPLFKITKDGDTTGIDIYADEDGRYDEDAIESYAGSDELLFCGYYGQGSIDVSIMETDFAKMPLFKKLEGVWRPVGTGGRGLALASFIGALDKSTISVFWQAPYTQPGGFTSPQAGISVGDGRKGAMSFSWTTGKGMHCYFTSQLQADFEQNDGRPYLGTLKIDGNQFTPFHNGAPAGIPATLTAPPYNEIKLFGNNDAPGDLSIFGVHIWDNVTVDQQTIFNYYKNHFSELFPFRSLRAVAVGDSITTSTYVDPYNSWPRKAFLDFGLPDFDVVCRGGWKLSDILANISRLDWYADNRPSDSKVCVVFAGTNDLVTDTVEAATGNFAAIVSHLNARYTDIVAITCPPRDLSSGNAAHEAKRGPFNDWMRGSSGSLFTKVVNLDALPLGVNGAQDDSTWYVDHIHFNMAGQNAVAEAVTAALEAIYV